MYPPPAATASAIPSGLDPGPDPERLILVARRVEDGRYVFAQWGHWPHPTMISTLTPTEHEGLLDGIASLLDGRMRVRDAGAPRLAGERVAVRMSPPRGSEPRLGLLRPVAVEVAGEPEPDALIAGIALLTRDEAEARLATDVERAAFRAGVAALA